DAVFIVRIHADLRVVERTVVDTAIVRGHAPGFAVIVAAPQHAVFLGFDHGVHHGRIGTAGAHADSPQEFRARESVMQRRVGEPGPRLTAIGGTVETASRTTAAVMPRPPQVVVHARVNDARVAGFETDVAGAGGRVHVQHALPRRATVGGAEYAALF